MNHQMRLSVSSQTSWNQGGHTEDDSLGLLDGFSESAHRNVSHPSVELLWGVEEIHQ
jgi:hypothetical protein